MIEVGTALSSPTVLLHVLEELFFIAMLKTEVCTAATLLDQPADGGINSMAKGQVELPTPSWVSRE